MRCAGITLDERPGRRTPFWLDEQRHPDAEVPITPTAELPVEDRNDHVGVIGERAEVDPRDDDVARRPVPTAGPAAGQRGGRPPPPRGEEVAPRADAAARRPVPTAVPAAGRRGTVPAARRWRADPVGWRAARRRAVIPTEPSLRRRRRRALADDAEADLRIPGATYLRAGLNVGSARNVGRVRRVGARRGQLVCF